MKYDKITLLYWLRVFTGYRLGSCNKEVENLQLPRLMLRGHLLVGQQAVDPDQQLGTQVNKTVNDCKIMF